MHEYKGKCDQRWLTGEVKGNNQVVGSQKLVIIEVSCDSVSGAKMSVGGCSGKAPGHLGDNNGH
jgi:hypothetical protein